MVTPTLTPVSKAVSAKFTLILEISFTSALLVAFPVKEKVNWVALVLTIAALRPVGTLEIATFPSVIKSEAVVVKFAPPLKVITILLLCHT